MGFGEILLLFICFCVISAGINILEKLISARMMKGQVKQYVDTAFNSIFVSFLKYRIKYNEVKEKKGVKENGNSNMSDM